MADRKIHILLVDDDQDDRSFFADALDGINMNTELSEFANGRDCLDYLNDTKSKRPDMIFLDLNMPIMNGYDCLKAIRENRDFSNIIVAIYSTSSSERDIENTFLNGANIYIKKPSRFNDLKNSLKQVIKMNLANRMNDFKRDNFLLRV